MQPRDILDTVRECPDRPRRGTHHRPAADPPGLPRERRRLPREGRLGPGRRRLRGQDRLRLLSQRRARAAHQPRPGRRAQRGDRSGASDPRRRRPADRLAHGGRRCARLATRWPDPRPRRSASSAPASRPSCRSSGWPCCVQCTRSWSTAATRPGRGPVRAAGGQGLAAAAGSAAEAAAADIVITTTPATAPVLAAEDVRPGAHVTGIGTDMPHKNELPAALLRPGRGHRDRRPRAVPAPRRLRSGRASGRGRSRRRRRRGRRPAIRRTAIGRRHHVADLTGVGAVDAAVASRVVAALLG